MQRMPDDWFFTYVGSNPEVFMTSFFNLFMEAGLRGGETVHMRGGASGAGRFGIQMAHAAVC